MGRKIFHKKETRRPGKEKDLQVAAAEAADKNDRETWGSQTEFLASCLSYAVGLGNLWRFPYLCFKHGGAFLIPYSIMMTFAGIPMFFMETAFGQFARQGVITVWNRCPSMKGIGIGMFLVSCIVGIYYNVVITWAIQFLIASFSHPLPWSTCENNWNTPACGTLDLIQMNNCTSYGGVWHNHDCVLPHQVSAETFDTLKNTTGNMTLQELLSSRQTASDEFFHNYVLEISDGFHEMGPILWRLALCLLFSWTMVFLCVFKSIKSSGKAVYFTALFPYVVLLILLVRGATLPGAKDGILYYLTPQWEKLLTAEIWGDAAVQIFFSLSPCWGGLITLSSFNRFHNDCLRDALAVSFGNCGTSLFAGFVVFSIIGFSAHTMNLPIEMVVEGGPGLAFVIYPEVVAKLPISPLWATLFFLMLITLGMGTQLTVVTTVHTTLLDVFPKQLKRGRRPMILTLVICVCGYFMGLLCITQGGMYMLHLIDSYGATYSVLIIGFCECVYFSHIYEADKFLKDIEQMIRRKPSVWWKIVWKYITPPLLLFIMIFTWVDFKRSSYGTYRYPAWADALGWLLSMTSVLPIPMFFAMKFVQRKYAVGRSESLRQTLKALITPQADNEHHDDTQDEESVPTNSTNKDQPAPNSSTPACELHYESETRQSKPTTSGSTQIDVQSAINIPTTRDNRTTSNSRHQVTVDIGSSLDMPDDTLTEVETDRPRNVSPHPPAVLF